MTGTNSGRPTHIEISDETSGLVKPGRAMAEQFRAIFVRRLAHRLGCVGDMTMERLRTALFHLLQA
ncbi:type II toxin-antitoxin system PemK/MazF family toxin [Thermopolyspora flexuosa]|uniref:type II toxin-antitoxin system PemK/MazF family toxin n=1 Tax=Thermopolyspora flexuosa TaxID=103836 RepID=UPI00114F555F